MKTNVTLSLLTIAALAASCTHTAPLEDKPLVIDSPKTAEYYRENDHELCSENHSFVKHKSSVDWVNFNKEPKKEEQSREISSEESLLELAGSEGCKDITELEIKEVSETITRLGGKLVDPMEYTANVEGLAKYMAKVGVDPYFNAEEMITPYNSSVAKKCGNDDLLPPRCRWLSGAVQGMIATKIYEFVNDKSNSKKEIILRNWWRPSCYNRGVDGATTSDHIQARGFDLDFRTSQDRARAQNFVCQMYKDKPFNLQVGIGCNTLHVGVGSPKRMENFPKDGSRFWTYGSLDGCEVKRLKTDDCFVMDKKGHKYLHSDDLTAKDGAL